MLFLLLVSPVGAPILGWVFLDACDIPEEGPSRCPLPDPLGDYFLTLAFMPFVWVGPFLAILWLFLSLAVLLGCLWNAARTIWLAVMERK